MSMARTLLRVDKPPMRYEKSPIRTEQWSRKYSGSKGPSFTEGGSYVMISVVLVGDPDDPTQPPVIMKNSKDKTMNANFSLFGRTKSTK